MEDLWGVSCNLLRSEHSHRTTFASFGTREDRSSILRLIEPESAVSVAYATSTPANLETNVWRRSWRLQLTLAVVRQEAQATFQIPIGV